MFDAQLVAHTLTTADRPNKRLLLAITLYTTDELDQRAISGIGEGHGPSAAKQPTAAGAWRHQVARQTERPDGERPSRGEKHD
ncbi:MAG: hypothetical protein CSA65_01135 [Proteobacteria bacterium]|nr:MAG: hypothetical protein CSA65_01135 [Pseudomonadota bacterium]